MRRLNNNDPWEERVATYLERPIEQRLQQLRDTVSDLAADFYYYDRKEDPDLPVGAIEAAVRNGDITVDQLAAIFAEKFRF